MVPYLCDSSTNLKWSYDVFLSFRVEDTHYNFISHLNMAMHERGINHYKLEKQEEIISLSVLKNIEESMISIVVLSESYMSSSWCLDELVKIMECKESNNQIVFPVFYKVDPSHVRIQESRLFMECFFQFGITKKISTKKNNSKYLAEDGRTSFWTKVRKCVREHTIKFREKIVKWKRALHKVAVLQGWHFGGRTTHSQTIWKIEAELIKDLVEKVWHQLNGDPFFKHPIIGIESQIENMNLKSYINSKLEATLMVGIYGMGGMGKTTLAQALFDQFSNQFEGCSFLSNVKDASKPRDGLAKLQEKILSDILLMDHGLKVGDHDRGINIIGEKLDSKRVLIILDDVDSSKQLEALAGKHDWFGLGSVIIATTRNKHLLHLHNFDIKYQMKGLSSDQAIELFNWHAFRQKHPPDHQSRNIDIISKCVVEYCKGLPLAIEALGSSFFFSKTEHQNFTNWEDHGLEFLKNSKLDKRIMDSLQISYDGLDDDDELQKVFLYISCFCIDEKISNVEEMLETCGLCPYKAITILKDLSLLNIEKNSDKVQMHELIQQMGQTILLSSESSQPRKKKMVILIGEDSIQNFINTDKGAKAVQAMKLIFPVSTSLDIKPQVFKNVKNLRVLIVQNATSSLPKDMDLDFQLPENLVWIKWVGYPYSSLPLSYSPKKLRVLNLQHSSIKSLGQGFMACEWLKKVDLSNSKLLEELPDLSSAQNLEELLLSDCTSLVKVHESVGSLGKLATLNLYSCSSLKRLPNCFMLKSLESLEVYGCVRLEKFPHVGEKISNIRSIHLNSNSIRELPQSFGNLTGLEHLFISECTNLKTLPDTIQKLVRLRELRISSCENLITLPNSIGCLTALQKLELINCTNLTTLPDTIHDLTTLKVIKIQGCSNLKSFTSSPSSRKRLI